MADTPIVTNPNALWAFILNELRSSAYVLGPSFQEISELSMPRLGSERSPKVEYEQMLTLLDDAIELCRQVRPDLMEKRSLNFSQVAEDFSEAYARRFGSDMARSITLCVDPALPSVKGSPHQMVRILDCLVRAAQPNGQKHAVHFVIRANKKSNSVTDNCEVVLRCKGIPLTVSQSLISEFISGNYIRCVRELGLPLCTAMHMARSVGGTVSTQAVEGEHGSVEMHFMFERVKGAVSVPNIPKVFYLMTQSPELQNTIQTFADFYCSKVVLVDSAYDVPQNAKLIFDAQELSDSTMERLKALPRPDQTTLILSTNAVFTWRELNKYGFLNFATVPLVSSRILSCISGSAAYEMPHSAQEASSLRKLRVLIVDDTATARIVLRDHFELAGHGVIEAADGAELVAQIKSGGRFDIIFCDQTMSHMDGATAVREVRAFEEPLGRHTPIVLMTAYTPTTGPSEEDRELFDLMVTKPIKTQLIDAALNDLVYSPINTVPMQPRTMMIDLDDLSERCSGKAQTMLRVLESFIKSSKASLLTLKANQAEGDKVMLARTLHTIKGLLRDAGAKDAAQRVEEIELKATDPNYNLEEDLPNLEKAVEAACKGAQSAKEELSQRLIAG